MSQQSGDRRFDINRRRVLQGIGGAGVIAVAGCADTDPEETDDTAAPTDDDTDDDTTEPGVEFPLEVTLEVNADNDDRVRMVELIAESMEESGFFETEVETYEWNTYVGRVLDTEYATEEDIIPCIGLSGTFNPHSFCDALHHSSNNGACCNLTGINDPELDDLLDSARFGFEVSQDPDLRRETYDEIWRKLAEESYSSIIQFDLSTAVTNTDVHNFSMWPFNEGILTYALYTPAAEQVIWLDRDNAATGDDDISDLQEGGTLRVGASENPASFDPPNSSDTTSTLAQSPIFEGLTAADTEGNLYPWLAESWELVDAQDIDRLAYEEYMSTVGTTDEGAVDTTEQIIVRHPEDNPEEDDEVRVLLPDDAREAAEDGTYGMHFRYELRDGVSFHNGEEFSAEHVVESMRYYENTVNAPQTFDSVLAAIEEDDLTVSLYAQVPDAEAERELPGISILSLENIEDAGADGQIDPREDVTPYGTGAYTLDVFEDQQFAEYSKFDDYWVEDFGVENFDWFDGPAGFPDGPVIEELELEFIPEDPTRSAALQNDEVDLTYGLATGTLDDFDASDDFLVAGVETGGYEYIQYPVNGPGDWDDQRLRRAVNHLIPRQQIVDNVLAGWARAAWTDLPELAHGTGTVDHDALEEELRPMREFDPARAAELLEDFQADQ